jgi:hypothetical protein
MRNFAELEGHLRSGAIGYAAAAQMGRLCLRPGFVMPGDSWINDATTLSLKDLKRKIKTRLEEKRTGQTGLAEMHFVVPQATRSKFDRCREKACTRAKMHLSDGQVLDRMCDNYLEDSDPLKKDSGGGRRGRRARKLRQLCAKDPGTATPNRISLAEIRALAESSASTGEEPVAEPQVTERPVTEQPVTQQSVTQQSVTQQSVTEQPVTEQPVAGQAVIEQPMADQAVAEQPEAKQPAAKRPEPEPPVEEVPAVARTADLRRESRSGTSSTESKEITRDSQSASLVSRRRLGPTALIPWSRYVPRDVERALLERSGGRCEVPGCGRRGVQLAHVRRHKRGSGREVGDLLLLCPTHHALYDADRMPLAGRDEAGRPQFRIPGSGPRGPPG